MKIPSPAPVPADGAILPAWGGRNYSVPVSRFLKDTGTSLPSRMIHLRRKCELPATNSSLFQLA